MKPHHRPVVGDVNGDGKADLVLFTNDNAGDVYVLLSTGRGFGKKHKWHNWFAPEGETPAVADVNGDGKGDIVTFTQGMNGNNVWVAFSTGSQFTQSQCWHNNFAWTTETPRVGSFDGDSRADIITFTRNWAQWVYVGLSDGSQSFQVDLWHTNFGRGRTPCTSVTSMEMGSTVAQLYPRASCSRMGGAECGWEPRVWGALPCPSLLRSLSRGLRRGRRTVVSARQRIPSSARASWSRTAVLGHDNSSWSTGYVDP